MSLLTKIKESFKNLVNHDSKLRLLLRSEAFKIGAVIFSGLVLLMFIVPIFFNNSALKFQMEQKVSKTIGANFTINGDVEVMFLPSLSIIANDVLLQNYVTKEKNYNFYAKSVQIKLPFFKFSSSNWIKKVIVSNAIIESYYSLQKPKNRENKFTKRSAQILEDNPHSGGNKSTFDISAKLFSVSEFEPLKINHQNAPAITFINSRVITYNSEQRKTEIQKINLDLTVDKEKILSHGSFRSEKISNDFSLEANFNQISKTNSSFLELHSPIANITIKGNFLSENKGILKSDFKGKIDAEILELKSFYKGYISNNKAIYGKIKPGVNPIKISADLNNSKREVIIDNLVINSNLMNGSGNIDLDFNSDITIADINLDLKNLDLDNIWSQERIALEKTKDGNYYKKIPDETTESRRQKANKNKGTDLVSALMKDPQNSPIDLNTIKAVRNLDLTSEIKIQNVKFLKGEIKDIDLYLTISKDGELMVLPLTCTLPGNGKLRINGVLANNDDLPRFIGKIDISGKKLSSIFSWLKIESQNLKFNNLKKYILYSDLMLRPNVITLDNFYLNLNNDQSEFLGEITIDSSDKTTNIHNKIKISSFDISDYFLISGKNAYLSRGSLLKKLLWLNDINSNNHLDLSFDELTYKGEKFLNQSLQLGFGQGYLKLSDLNLKSDKTNLKANLAVDIRSKIPKFGIDVVANNFNYESSSNSQNPDLDIQKSLQKTSKIKQGHAADQFFQLPSLEGFNGKILLKFDNLNIDDTNIKNAKLIGSLKDGNIDVSELICTLYGGELTYKGLVGMKNNKTINGNLTLKEILLEELLPSIVDVDTIKGVTNVSATVTSSASNSKDFTKNLSSEIRFSANAPVVKGYGLNNLVRKMFTFRHHKQDLHDPEKILFNPKSETTFTQANGSISIKRKVNGSFKINLTAPALNGIASGKINLVSNHVDGLLNVIFLTGDRQKQIPINIATSLKGNMSSISHNSNLDQVKQYLGIKITPSSDLKKTKAQ